jgi:hypothetical protein
LQSLSWFMKCLKEPLSRLANRQDKTRGAFFEGRSKSVAVVDEESLLRICVYIDLNPVAAKVAETPEARDYTSIKQRVDHVKAQGRTAELAAAQGAASPVRVRRPAWRSRCGSVRSKAVAGWIRTVKV